MFAAFGSRAFRRTPACGTDNGAYRLKRGAAVQANGVIGGRERKSADGADGGEEYIKEIVINVGEGLEHEK